MGILWETIANKLESIVKEKSDKQIDELSGVFEETRRKMSELLV